MILFAWRRKIPVWSLFDVIGASAPVGLGLVRIANFVNSELWGKLTAMPWAVEFPNGGPFPRHPTQIYEAVLEGLVLFFVLRLATHRWLKLGSAGFVCGLFIAGYGLARIFVEFFREPDQQIGYLFGGWLTMGMVLSVPMVLAGLWAMLTARRAAEPARA
jgi:phosphatidylglycerol:prolipoprotein diacylglycerol transferase